MPRWRTPRAAPNKRKLTDLYVRTVKPETRRCVVWDTKAPGLALSIEPTGSLAWKYVYRFGNRPRWLTIGNARAISLAAARRLAIKAALQVAEDVDPQAERMAGRTANTFEALATRYRVEYASKRNKSWRQAAALIDRYVLPKWAKLRAADVKRADVAALHGHYGDRPVLANQIVAAASAIFSWCIKQEVVTSNPCRLVDLNKTTSRERVLSDSEIALLWPHLSPGLKLILLTGQRPGEVSAMRREHLVDGWWEMPGAPVPKLDWPGTKNGETHRVWLPAPARELLAQFFDGSKHSQLADEMRELSAKLEIERVTPHDLRRTHGTMITRLGFGRDCMNRIQNHKDGGIGSVYDRHHYADENRRAMEAVAGHIVDLAEGRAAGNVIEGRFRAQKN
jgi:integrase